MSEGVISVVVPTLQESENLRLLTTRIHRALSLNHRPYEIIIVDDNSQDGSEEIIAKLADEGYPVRIAIRIGERGLGSAVIHGFNEAVGQFLVCMDADLSHPPELIPKLIECLEKDECDFVVGSRYISGSSTEETWGLFRWLNSKVAGILARPFTKVKDPMSGFFALPRNVFRRAATLSPIGYKIGLELMVKCSPLRITEIPIHFADRVYGKSKLNFKEQCNYLKHLKRLAEFKYGDLLRFTLFCLVGCTGMVVDLTTYTILLKSAVGIKLARAVAIWLAMTWNFMLNRRVTFSYSQNDAIVAQYLKFICSCGIGMVISWSTAVFLSEKVSMFSTHVLLAAFIGIVAGTLTNFWLSRLWVFSRSTS
jgi:dolichol-phosphate mannosyltransferase